MTAGYRNYTPDPSSLRSQQGCPTNAEPLAPSSLIVLGDLSKVVMVRVIHLLLIKSLLMNHQDRLQGILLKLGEQTTVLEYQD